MNEWTLILELIYNKYDCNLSADKLIQKPYLTIVPKNELL